MTKKELTEGIALALDLPRSTVLTMIQRTFDGIIETLVTEGRLELRNFGVFQVQGETGKKSPKSPNR
jgi:nucleoid DNA-binding protein